MILHLQKTYIDKKLKEHTLKILTTVNDSGCDITDDFCFDLLCLLFSKICTFCNLLKVSFIDFLFLDFMFYNLVSLRIVSVTVFKFISAFISNSRTFGVCYLTFWWLQHFLVVVVGKTLPHHKLKFSSWVLQLHLNWESVFYGLRDR